MRSEEKWIQGPKDLARPFKLQKYQRQLGAFTSNHLLGKITFCFPSEKLGEGTTVLGFSCETYKVELCSFLFMQ